MLCPLLRSIVILVVLVVFCEKNFAIAFATASITPTPTPTPPPTPTPQAPSQDLAKPESHKGNDDEKKSPQPSNVWKLVRYIYGMKDKMSDLEDAIDKGIQKIKKEPWNKKSICQSLHKSVKDYEKELKKKKDDFLALLEKLKSQESEPDTKKKDSSNGDKTKNKDKEEKEPTTTTTEESKKDENYPFYIFEMYQKFYDNIVEKLKDMDSKINEACKDEPPHTPPDGSQSGLDNPHNTLNTDFGLLPENFPTGTGGGKGGGGGDGSFSLPQIPDFTGTNTSFSSLAPFNTNIPNMLANLDEKNNPGVGNRKTNGLDRMPSYDSTIPSQQNPQNLAVNTDPKNPPKPPDKPPSNPTVKKPFENKDDFDPKFPDPRDLPNTDFSGDILFASKVPYGTSNDDVGGTNENGPYSSLGDSVVASGPSKTTAYGKNISSPQNETTTSSNRNESIQKKIEQMKQGLSPVLEYGLGICNSSIAPHIALCSLSNT